MASVSIPIKWLKDESKNKFSPVVSMDSIFNKDGTNLGSVFKTKLLFNGSTAIPTLQSGNYTKITVTEDVNNFDYMFFVRTNNKSDFCSTFVSLNVDDSNLTQTIYRGFCVGCSNLFNEKTLLIQTAIRRISSTQVEVGENCLLHLYTTGNTLTIPDYTSLPLKKLVGIKLI